MAISKFFDEFPVRMVSTGADNIKIVTDIFRRVRIREDYQELVQAYYEQDLQDAERPDEIAEKEYQQPTLHWMTMLVNNVINPYHDWVMTDKTMDNFIATKYPNRFVTLTSSHFDSSGKLFLPNETIITSGGASGTVVSFDASNLQLIYKLTTASNFADTNVITGSSSDVTGTVTGNAGLERNAVSHYEIQRELRDDSIERIVVDKGVSRSLPNPLNNNTMETYTATAVTYSEKEINRNDDNRKIKLLDSNRITDFKKDFKKKITL